MLLDLTVMEWITFLMEVRILLNLGQEASVKKWSAINKAIYIVTSRHYQDLFYLEIDFVICLVS